MVLVRIKPSLSEPELHAIGRFALDLARTAARADVRNGGTGQIDRSELDWIYNSSLPSLRVLGRAGPSLERAEDSARGHAGLFDVECTVDGFTFTPLQLGQAARAMYGLEEAYAKSKESGAPLASEDIDHAVAIAGQAFSGQDLLRIAAWAQVVNRPAASKVPGLEFAVSAASARPKAPSVRVTLMSLDDSTTSVELATQPCWPSGAKDLDVVRARLDLSDAAGLVVSSIELDAEAWSALEEESLRDFLDDIRHGADLESALRARLDWMVNHYTHDECDVSWDDEHSCACDDECPKCGVDMTPHDSTVVQQLEITPAEGSDRFYDTATLVRGDSDAEADVVTVAEREFRQAG